MLQGILKKETLARLLQFTLILYSLVRNPAAARFIELILNRSPVLLNKIFFDTFTREFNIQFYNLIGQENARLRSQGEKITFQLLIDLFCRFINFLIQTVFIQSSPERTSQNFVDHVSRYTGPKIALIVLELVIFREFPLSDSLWDAYLLSDRQEIVTQVFQELNIPLPETSFYDRGKVCRFSMIATDLSANVPMLSNWLVTDLIIPFAQFEKTIGVPFDFDGNEENFDRFAQYFINYAKDHEEQEIFVDILLTLQAMSPA